MISLPVVTVFYGLMGALGVALAIYWAQINPLVWQGSTGEPLVAAVVGVVAGFVVVALSDALDRVAAWARRLSAGFKEMLGPLTLVDIAVIAVLSSVCEELFFRGFLLQALSVAWLPESIALPGGVLISSLVFGALHIGPDWKTFWPWTLMAFLMGLAFAAMFILTGNLLAPILAHFTINFINLISITQGEDEE